MKLLTTVPLAVAAVLPMFPCAAQTTVVSPTQYANVSGTSAYAGPWYNVDRCQQIHADLHAHAGTIKSLGWRRAGFPVPEANSVARTIEAEFFMAPSDFNNIKTTFAANYAAPRQTIVNRKSIQLPDWVQPQGSPAPFTFVVPLDVPFAYAGNADLVWEVVVWANTRNSNYLTDAFAGVLELPGDTRYQGRGCTTAGQSLPLVHTVRIESRRAPDQIEGTWTLINAPNNVVAALLVGTSNPNLTLPYLCGPIVTDAEIVIGGTTSMVGGLTIGPLSYAFQPSFVGGQIYSQFVTSDPSQAGLPFAVSNGAFVVVPDLPPPLPLVTTVRSNGDPGASVGYKLDYRGHVVQFGY